MCISLLVQVIEVKTETALVSDGPKQYEVGRRLLPNVQAGDWVLVYAGQMVSTIAAEEAQTMRELLDEIANGSQANIIAFS
jgi:hydrogenase assembly chaperone HypC/HupF